ncbi:MAG: hypothetical protein SGJ09_13665 [Phycisphaerae bacterium]|nr:hypothetical protein [Phycisphaerae bacterium]
MSSPTPRVLVHMRLTARRARRVGPTARSHIGAAAAASGFLQIT